MTKQEWLECTDANKMLNQITDERKLRLFACAIARQVWHLLEEPSKNAVIVAEKFADGEVTEEELKIAKLAAFHTASFASSAVWWSARDAAWHIVRKNHYNLLHEITNPYHIPQIYPNLAKEIAQNIYKTQDFTGTGILADALEEHGIMDQDLLLHLRKKNHLRGCWAIDVIKEM